MTKKILKVVGIVLFAVLFCFMAYSTIKIYFDHYVNSKVRAGQTETMQMLNASIVNEVQQTGQLMLKIKNAQGVPENVILIKQ